MTISRFTKSLVILNCAVPALLLLWDAINGDLGANPVNFAIRTTGILSLIFLLLTLGVTPVSRLAGWSWLGQFRRVAGLYAFFHAALHFGLFFLFDRAADVVDTASEIWMRRYLLVGLVGLLAMTPLAVTSTNRMIQRVGPKRWKLLHRLTYLAAMAGVLHYYLLVKADTTYPLIFATILAALLAYRLIAHYLQLRSDAQLYRSGPGPRAVTTPAAAMELAAAAPARQRPWTGKLRVARVFDETPEVRTFRLVSPDGPKLPFDFLPGQFLSLTLEIDGRKVRRSYTLASSPTRSGYCELTIKREERGLASRFLHDSVREGDLLEVTAPAGRFTFTGAESPQLVLIAGGVGITPLMSKVRYLTDVCWPGAIHLIISAKTERDLIFRGELEELQRRFANLKVTITLTREENPAWTGERGRLGEALLRRAVPELAASRFHLCGPTEMTTPIVALLGQMGVAPDQVKLESFASPSRKLADKPVVAAVADPEPSAPPAAAVPGATLRFARSAKTIANPNGHTILELAERHGIAIPYDCRAGVCGQCKTRLLSGKVVMDAEDALDPVDRAGGLILCCQARCQDTCVVDA